MNIIAVVIALVGTSWLLLIARDWWELGTSYRRTSCSAFVEPILDDWRRRIEDARANLTELQTPGWYDRQWPICTDLDLSSDGEYCRRCFRQAWEHQACLVSPVANQVTQDGGDYAH